MAEDLTHVYQAYRTDPSQDNLHKVVKALEPTIQYSLASVNAHDDPIVRGKASVFAAEAIERFNPDNTAKASLPTFVSSQLRQLSRSARQSRSPVRVPERIQLDAFKIHQATKRFMDETGREPDALELADYTGMPLKRLEKVRRFQISVPSEQQVGDLTAQTPDHENEALTYIHFDSDHVDRRILEHKTGFGGAEVLTPKEIAARLKLSPTQLSRRSMRLAMRINQVSSALKDVV